MKAIDAIKKIKIALGLEKFEAVAKLVDGTEVHVEGEFAPGEQLHVVAEDGSFLPAPEGEHITEDGMKITVDAAGVIVSVEESAEEVAAEKEEEMEKEEEKMEEIEVETPVEGEVAAEITEEVVQAVVDAIAPVVAEVAQITEEMKKLKASFAEFSNEPAGEPVRNNFSKESKSKSDSIDSRLEVLAALRNKK